MERLSNDQCGTDWEGVREAMPSTWPNDCKEATGRDTWKPRKGSGECSTGMQEQVSGKTEATGTAREPLRVLLTVLQPTEGSECWRRQVTQGINGARVGRTALNKTDFQRKSKGKVYTILACVMPALQTNAKDR